MAKSTRTTFTASKDGPIITVVELLSQSLRDRAEQQQAAVRQPPNAPALAAPGGQVQRLGGEPLRPRSDQASGAIPVGGVVQVNQGVRSGQPAGAAATQQQQQPTGWLQGNGDPNELGLVPRVRGDRYFDKLSKTLWVWQQISDEEAEWVTVNAPAIIMGTTPPSDPGDFDGQGYYASLDYTFWLWRSALPPTEENPGEWIPMFAPTTPGNGNPDPEFFRGLIQGQGFLNVDNGRFFLWSVYDDDWLPVSSGADVQVLDAAPIVAPPSDQAIAFVRDPKEVYVWDAEAATPAWLGPYGAGGGGIKIAVRNFFNDAAFNFDTQPIAWDGATRTDDFTNTFQADGDIIIAVPGWYRLSLQIYQGATDTGIEREITHQFRATLRDPSNETVPLGDEPDRLLTFAGFSNFNPGTGQTDWVFEAATAGKITVEWYWFGFVGGGNITNAFVGGRAMLEKLK